MRTDVKPSKIILAVAKAAEASFNRGQWLEFGYETGFADEVRSHPRLLRSLDWGDDDYYACVLDIMEEILRPQGRTVRHGSYGLVVTGISPEPFKVAERMLNLPKWLAENDRPLYDEIYEGGEFDAGVDELQAAAERLGLPDVDAHAARIRKGLRDDPAQAIGSSKELLETVLKAVLGLHGNGPETKKEIPALTKQASASLGLDAGGVRADEPGAEQRKKVLGSLAQLVFNTAELRNAGYGTGHGLSRGPSLDVATARLAVSAAVAAATFYIEAHAADRKARPAPSPPT